MLRVAGRSVAALLAGGALGIALRMALFSLAASVLGIVPALVAPVLAVVAPHADPVYTRAALGTATDIQLGGIAVWGWLGDALHQSLPALFAPSERAAGALARVVAAPGSAVLPRLIAAGVAHTGVLAVGLVLALRGVGAGRVALVLAGVGAQVQVAVSVLGARPTLDELEATGLSFAVNALVPSLTSRRTALSDLFEGAPPPALAAALVSLALILAYVLAGAGVSLALVARGWLRGVRLAGWPRPHAPHWSRSLALHPVILVAGLLVASAALAATAQEARSDASAASLKLRMRPLGARRAATATPVAAGAAARDRWWLASLSAAPPGGSLVPSRVEVRGSDRRFTYLVNGEPQVIRGMGLNTQYRTLFNAEDRAARLDADLETMQRMGVNTVLGWDPLEIDQTVLDLAAKHGMGVVLPFDLRPDVDYTDPTVRAGLTQDVVAWVQENRRHPALRMWGLGNEVLHKIVHPSWLGPQDPARDRQARAFSKWLVETADTIHALDPDHPVTYRSAEDAFIPWVADALKQRGGGPRPWFVWGTNTYSDHLGDIVDAWPGQGAGLALWVSEFAPGGLALPDRPSGFTEMWGYVRRHPDWVLGGAVYAWTRNGPEEIDRTMGLTDDGTPFDRTSMDALGALFAVEQARAPLTPSP